MRAVAVLAGAAKPAKDAFISPRAASCATAGATADALVTAYLSSFSDLLKRRTG